MTANYPTNCWYVAATSDEITREPLARTLLGRPVVLFRRENGDVVALEDRCAHRRYPLSKGKVEGDQVVCAYHGFRYNPDGRCVEVPSQPRPPFGAAVTAYQVQESSPFVWIWLGEPNVARLHHLPHLPWLGDGWASTGTNLGISANYLLVHEHYLDLSHIPHVHPQETPPTMQHVPPLDSIEVSEASVTYSRELPPAPLADWEATATGLPRDREYERRHYGRFISPAVLVEGWEISDGNGAVYGQVRIQAVTPESPTTTHMFWRFARDYNLSQDTVGDRLHAVFEHVLRTDIDVIECIEATAGYVGSTRGVRVTADAGVLKVRRIIDAMLLAQGDPHPSKTSGQATA